MLRYGWSRFIFRCLNLMKTFCILNDFFKRHAYCFVGTLSPLEKKDVSFDLVLGGIVGLGLLGYLGYVLLYPDRF